MPNYDAGHYFLTVLAPIRLDSLVINGQSHSRRHLLREALAALPTVEGTPFSRGRGTNAPFTRCTRTHFARFAVLDDVVYNGRESGNTLVETAKSTNLLRPQPVDRLTTPFLIFGSDFDAANGDPTELRGYLMGLWDKLGGELESVFRHCVGFDEVKSAAEFAIYIMRCQIETTMPFNDYWSTAPDLKTFSFKPALFAAAAAVLLAIATAWKHESLWLLLTIIPLWASVAWLTYRAVLTAGQKPFPRSAPPGAGIGFADCAESAVGSAGVRRFHHRRAGHERTGSVQCIRCFHCENQTRRYRRADATARRHRRITGGMTR